MPNFRTRDYRVGPYIIRVKASPVARGWWLIGPLKHWVGYATASTPQIQLRLSLQGEKTPKSIDYECQYTRADNVTQVTAKGIVCGENLPITLHTRRHDVVRPGQHSFSLMLRIAEEQDNFTIVDFTAKDKDSFRGSWVTPLLMIGIALLSILITWLLTRGG